MPEPVAHSVPNPQCEMSAGCVAPVTHIGEKGYIYCAGDAVERRNYAGERTRKMRKWELDLIKAGKPVPSYRYEGKPSNLGA